jgi:hypothetical protein
MAMNTKKLDVAKVTAEPIVVKGTKFLKHLKISLNEIHVPPMNNNSVRKDTTNHENVNNLKQSMEKGIKYNLLPPIVRKNPQFIDGKSYNYELIDGHHRWHAMQDGNCKEWIFSLYEFGLDGVSYENSVEDLQLTANDHPPQLPASVADVANIIVKRINSSESDIENNEYSIREYVNRVCKNRATAFKGKVEAAVIKACGTWQDVITYTQEGVNGWVAKEGYVVGGKLDKTRDEHGWSVKDTRFVNEFKMSGILKLAETNKESYFLFHTLAPTESQDLNAKRNAMIKHSKKTDAALFKFAEWVVENKRMPWHDIGFLPQDKKANETDLIKIG